MNVSAGNVCWSWAFCTVGPLTASTEVRVFYTCSQKPPTPLFFIYYNYTAHYVAWHHFFLGKIACKSRMNNSRKEGLLEWSHLTWRFHDLMLCRAQWQVAWLGSNDSSQGACSKCRVLSLHTVWCGCRSEVATALVCICTVMGFLLGKKQ